MRRFPAPQQAQYGAPTASAAAPGVQPANYQPQPWQQGNAAQPAVYQAPVADQPARSEPAPSFNYQQPPPPYEPAPPAYYPRQIKAIAQR